MESSNVKGFGSPSAELKPNWRHWGHLGAKQLRNVVAVGIPLGKRWCIDCSHDDYFNLAALGRLGKQECCGCRTLSINKGRNAVLEWMTSPAGLLTGVTYPSTCPGKVFLTWTQCLFSSLTISFQCGSDTTRPLSNTDDSAGEVWVEHNR